MADSDPKADIPPVPQLREAGTAVAAPLAKSAVPTAITGVQFENFLGKSSKTYYWVGLAVVAVVFAAQAALTWRKWPDVLVDFGTQLYIPWRILNGAVLYRDLFYFAGGPFSQYFNALLFKIFGVSFSTLIAANLILAAAMIFVAYRYFLAAADIWTATLIATGIIVIFAFAEYTPTGNYNYVAPYSHESTHGLFVSVFAIALLSTWIRKGNIRNVAVAGLCAGIVFLTKPDISLALGAAVAAAFILRGVQCGVKGVAQSVAVFFAVATVPSWFFLVYFLRAESLHDSARSIVFGWLPVVHGSVTKNLFYRWCTGLDAPWAHLREIAVYFVAVILAAAVFAFVAWGLGRCKLRPGWQCIVALVLIAPLLIWLNTFGWVNCGWPLPLLSLSACILISLNFKELEEPAFPLLWSVFGFMLMAKLGLFPRIWHYGFVLAMPALVTSIYLLFWVLPRLLERRFAAPAVPFRLMVGLVLLIGFENLFHQSQSIYAQKSLPLGTGGDEIVTYNPKFELSQGIYAAMLWTQKYMPRDATLAVIPEGVTLNYLTRHVNPTPCLFWDPNALSVFGQTRMTDAVKTNPPDYIFIVEKSSSDFGVGYFGSSPDYGLGLMQWIQKNYKTELLIGHEPLKDGHFGIKIMEHLPAAPVQSGGTSRSSSARFSGERKFMPTTNEASVQPKPSGVM